MRTLQQKFSTSILVLFLLLAIGCSLPFDMGGGKLKTDDTQAVATVGGKSISLGELHEWMKEQFLKELIENASPSKRYEAESSSLERLIEERLLAQEAKKQGLSNEEELIAKSLEEQPEVTEADVRAFYDQNAARMNGRPFESISEMIRQYLMDRRESQAVSTLLKGLREAAEVTVLLEQPRIQVTASGASIGPDDAPVTIVEFSDYQCPYCLRAEPTMWQLVDKYPTQVRWVYRHFPLPIHGNAHGAAEAAVCARTQGKFWELHRLLFRNNRNLDRKSLSTYAEQAGLDVEVFDECMSKGLGKAAVDSDIAEGRSLGISGTPNFFVNGIAMTGAQPLEKFEEIIQRELARSTGAKPNRESSSGPEEEPAPAKEDGPS